MTRIFEAMAAIMADTMAIGKDQTNHAQKFKFRGIDQVYDALHPIFAKHKVFLLTQVIDHSYQEKSTRSGGVALHHFLRVKFEFVADDGSKVESTIIGEAADSGDKGVNKCLSIALKYALFQALLIPFENDDPDAHTTEFKKGNAKQASPKAEAPGVWQPTKSACQQMQNDLVAVGIEFTPENKQFFTALKERLTGKPVQSYKEIVDAYVDEIMGAGSGQ